MSEALAVSVFRCDECGGEGIPNEQRGKFFDGDVGVCNACLRKMGIYPVSGRIRGTNLTPPKKRRKKVR